MGISNSFGEKEKRRKEVGAIRNRRLKLAFIK
jgi:hypothetical protein